MHPFFDKKEKSFMSLLKDKIIRKEFETLALKEWSFLSNDQKKYISYLLYTQKKYSNPNNSALLYALGISDEKPDGYVTRQTGSGFCDIDMDFEEAGRERVIEYVTNKYGADRVAHIGTFGQMKAKGAVRAAARTLGVPELGNRLSGMLLGLIHGKSSSIASSIEKIPGLAAIAESKSKEAEVLKSAQAIENIFQSVGVHACFPGDAKLLTENGYKRFSELVNSSPFVAITPNGPCCANVSYAGKKIIYELQYSKSKYSGIKNTIRLTEDHRILSSNGWIQAKDSIGLSVATWPVLVDKLNELAGWFWNDGGYSSIYRTGNICFNRVKDNEVKNYFEEFLGHEIAPHKFYLYHNTIDYIRDKFGPGFESLRHEKGLPKFNYVQEKIAWLRGMMSANASVQRGCIRLKLTSKPLCSFIKDSLQELGIVCSNLTVCYTSPIIKGRKINSRPAYQFEISPNSAFKYANLIGFLQTYKTKKLFNNKFQKITKIGVEDTYDFTVLTSEEKQQCGYVDGLLVHNSGIVIANEPLTNICPLFRGKKEEITTQWEMNNIEQKGLVKFDFLGLRTLSKMHMCVDLIKQRHGVTVDVDNLDLEDDKVFANLRAGHVQGVFQLETSSGMKDLSVRIRPTSLEDLTALVAIFRPGPLQAEYKDTYLGVRAGEREPEYLVSELKPILQTTSGWCIYQDEVVHTPTAFKQIKFLKEGDLIFTGNNKTTKVKKVWQTGNKDVYQYSSDGNQTSIITRDHPVLTLSGYHVANKALTIARPRIFVEEQRYNYDSKKAWLLGMFIGDGCCDDSSPVITCGTEIIADKVLNVLLKAFPTSTARKFFSTRAWYVGLKKDKDSKHSELNNWLRSVCIFGTSKNNKILPSEVFYWNESAQLSLLAGLFESDGCIHNTGIFYTSTNEVLLNQIACLLDQFRITFYRTINKIHIRDTDLFVKLTKQFFVFKNISQVKTSIASGLIVDRQLLKDLINKYREDRSIKTECVRRGLNNSIYHEKTPVYFQTLIRAFPEEHLEEVLRGPYCFHNIKETKLYKENVPVYDLETESEEHSFIVGLTGTVVHNCIYQEQVLQIAKELCGYSLAEADMLRRAIGKKKADEMKKHETKFKEGWVAHGLPIEKAEILWKQIVAFAEYAFNKCVDGDTRFYRPTISQGRNFTIAELFKIKNSLKFAKSVDAIPMRNKLLRQGYGYAWSLNNENRLVKNKIKDIRFMGEKPVYRVTTESGASITVTMNHKFPTSTGEKKLKDIVIGDKLFINDGWKSEDTVYRFNLEGNNFPKKGQQGFQKRNTSFTQLQSYQKQSSCESCQQTNKRLEVHHADGNHGNNNTANLKTFCVSCHKKAHYQMGRTKMGEKGLHTKLESIVSIDIAGIREVYDVEMDNPYHTFVVSTGIVTSNSHAAAYAMIAYQTAWLKTYYPHEWMLSILTCDHNDTDKIIKYISECKRLGIKVLPPDVNKSGQFFDLDDEKNIRFGLGPIKNLGESPVKLIIDERMQNGNFKSFHDFCNRIDLGIINRLKLESLVRAGAFDSFGTNRASLLSYIEQYWNYRKDKKAFDSKMDTYSRKLIEYDHRLKDIAEGKQSKTGKALKALKLPEKPEELSPPNIPNLYEMEEEELLRHEHELLGFFVTSHPLDKYQDTITTEGLFTLDFIKDLFSDENPNRPHKDTPVTIAAVPAGIKEITNKHKKNMAFVDFEDLTGQMEGVIFTKQYEKIKENLIIGKPLKVYGKIDITEGEDEENRIFRIHVIKIEELILKRTKSETYEIEIAADKAPAAAEILHHYRGNKHRAKLIINLKDGAQIIPKLYYGVTERRATLMKEIQRIK